MGTFVTIPHSGLRTLWASQKSGCFMFVSPSHTVGLERGKDPDFDYNDALSPSHAVGLERKIVMVMDEAQVFLSPSHAVGLERGKDPDFDYNDALSPSHTVGLERPLKAYKTTVLKDGLHPTRWA